jgi:hypothetical protein
MIKKIFAALIVSFLVASSFFAGTVLADKSDSQDLSLPEQAGIYDVPGRPNLKLRVFVHNPKEKAVLSGPVCTEDLDSRAVDGLTGWHLPSNWSYRLNPSSAPSSVRSSLSTIAGEAFGTWQGAANKVTFSPDGTTIVTRAKLDNQNIIAWGRTPGTALAVTYTWYYTATHEVAEVDTIMNSNRKIVWSWTPYEIGKCGLENTYDAQDILTHELGHWMGLEDEYESPYTENTMYGYGAKAEIKKDTLTSGDISGISQIY